jgi:hypothetical protein
VTLLPTNRPNHSILAQAQWPGDTDACGYPKVATELLYARSGVGTNDWELLHNVAGSDSGSSSDHQKLLHCDAAPQWRLVAWGAQAAQHYAKLHRDERPRYYLARRFKLGLAGDELLDRGNDIPVGLSTQRMVADFLKCMGKVTLCATNTIVQVIPVLCLT